MTLVSCALGCRTYSSAPLSRINCTVNAPCSPRPCSVHEACTSVTWRTLIVCSVCCSATYSPFFRAIDNYSVRPFVPATEGFKLVERLLCSLQQFVLTEMLTSEGRRPERAEMLTCFNRGSPPGPPRWPHRRAPAPARRRTGRSGGPATRRSPSWCLYR